MPTATTQERKENTNCLAGMLCPKCASPGPYNIHATCTVTVSDDGTTDARDFDWDNPNSCTCLNCDYTATIQDFHHAPA